MPKQVIRGLLTSTVLTTGVVLPVMAQETSPPAAPTPVVAAAAASGVPQDNTRLAAAPAVEAQRIEITGIRASLESARNKKRDAEQFVDVVVADDIGKLPDRNVAESLSRVSGIQVDRGIGEGTNVSIRGMRQNVFLYNDREIFDATGRGGTGLDQLGTTTYGLLSLVPSELISSLEVTKLAGADQISGGIGGIVDIRSRLPLDDGNQFVGKAGATYDELPGKYGREFFGLVSRKLTPELGVLVSLSHDQRSLEQQGLDTFSGYKQYIDPNKSATVPVFGNQDVRATDIQEDRRKTGFNAVVQWRPKPGFELVADTFGSRLTSERNRYWIGFNPTSGLSDAVYSDNNILLSGHAVTPVTTNTEYASVKDNIISSGLRGKFVLSDTLTGTADISGGHSSSSYHQLYLRMQPNSNINTSVDFDLTQGPFGAFAINGVNLSDPTQLSATIMFDSLFAAKTDNQAARVDLKKRLDAGWLDSFEFGGRISHVDSTQNPLVADIRPTGGVPATQLSSFLTTYSNPSFAAGYFNGLPRSYLVPSSTAFTSCAAAVPAFSQNTACTDRADQLTSIASTFDVKETISEGYGKLDYDGELVDRALSGNVGLRAIQRKLTSIGSLINADGSTTPNTADRTDNEFLPSGVARYELSKDTVVRLGAAKVVSFPNTADLNNGVRLYPPVYTNGVITQGGTGTGGSPQLKPFSATQIDVSFEKYFGRQAVASIGLFNKDISTYIIQQQITETYGGVDYLVTRKVNGEGAKVRGVEVLLQLPFYFLPAPFSGFGTMATYSFIDSKTPVHDATGRQLSFPGLSQNNVNLVGYYEQGPLSLRVAMNWRDKYLVSLSGANTGIYNNAYTDLSTTLRYDFSKSLSLGLEGNNLRNSKQRTYDGSPEGLRTNAIFGRIYKANLTFKY
jgi:iron complex outermembrane receptor protein